MVRFLIFGLFKDFLRNNLDKDSIKNNLVEDIYREVIKKVIPSKKTIHIGI